MENFRKLKMPLDWSNAIIIGEDNINYYHLVMKEVFANTLGS
jgi:hypothetical protein